MPSNQDLQSVSAAAGVIETATATPSASIAAQDRVKNILAVSLRLGLTTTDNKFAVDAAANANERSRRRIWATDALH
jgi:hypothetical protein